MIWKKEMQSNENDGLSGNGKSIFSAIESPAEILYGEKTEEEKKKRNLRNSLLNELGDSLESKHILYSSNDDLKKMKEEKEKNNFKKEVSTGAARPINEQEIKTFLYDETEEPEIKVKHKAKLLDKIPVKPKAEKTVSAKIAPDDWDKQEIPVNHIETRNQDNSIFSLENTKRARDFVQGSEGFRDSAYQDSAGVWTIGYGHTGKVNGKPITQGMKITKEEAEQLYKKDFENHIAPLKDIKTPLTKNQQIALASLIYNLGPGVLKETSLRKKLDAGDIKGAADEFDRYIYATNKNTGEKEVLKGLVNRRKREKELFLKPDEEP